MSCFHIIVFAYYSLIVFVVFHVVFWFDRPQPGSSTSFRYLGFKRMSCFHINVFAYYSLILFVFFMFGFLV